MPVKTKSLNIRKILYGVALLLAAGTQLGAVTALSSFTNPGPSQRGKAVTVHNMAGLQAAIAAARPGDQIVMADGTWTDAVIDFNAQATAAAPLP
jgi:poly(beta-D-mannuronate) lyase